MSCPVDHAAQRLSPTGCPISGNAAAFDPFSLAYQRDPAGTLAWAREQEPVFYSPELGYWVVTRYDDVKAVFRDNLLFSPSIALEKITPAPPEAAAILQRYGYAMNRTMVNEDEPDHMERRRLLMDAFLPEALARHEPGARAGAPVHGPLRGQGPRRPGGGDVLRDPADHRAAVSWACPTRARSSCASSPWRTRSTPGAGPRPGAAQGGRERRPLLAGGAEDSRRHDGQPDGEGWMYETIRQHHLHPAIVTESYLRSMMMAIMAAAHETTSNATANAFMTLLSHREAWEAICANPALIPNAVEECLRVAGSIIAWRRIATADTVVGGVAIPKGGKLLIVQASANFDPGISKTRRKWTCTATTRWST
jgi:cytochrome P450